MSAVAYNRVKGALFEAIIRVLLNQSGYGPLPVDPKYLRSDEIRGRGAWHQVDAFGLYQYGVPFLYPIRLICEVKNLDHSVGLQEIRNFIGVIRDIQEVYFVEKYGQSLDETYTKRYTDAAAFFSTTGYTVPAQDYAYAQGVKLISYESNDLVADIITKLETVLSDVNIAISSTNIGDFKEWCYKELRGNGNITDYNKYIGNHSDKLDDLKKSIINIHTSYIGLIQNNIPIHIISTQELPLNLFSQSDEIYCRIYYNRDKVNLFSFSFPDYDNFTGYFSLPMQFVERYIERILDEKGIKSENERRIAMISFKQDILTFIDIPVKHEGVRRTLRLNLDREWLHEILRRARVHRDIERLSIE